MKSDLRTGEKREEANDSTYDSNNSAGNMRQVQDDLVKLTRSLEEMKGDLKTLLGVSD